jgi:mandelate racemase
VNGLPLVELLGGEKKSVPAYISAHLLAVSPTAHRLEYLDLAGPILKEPVRIKSGHALVSGGPGIGLEWDEGAVERFLVR